MKLHAPLNEPVIYGTPGADCPVCGAAILHHASPGGGTWEDRVICECGTALHPECYWGRVATLSEFQEYRRQIAGGPEDYCPDVLCARCRTAGAAKARPEPEWRHWVPSHVSPWQSWTSYLHGDTDSWLAEQLPVKRADLDKVHHRLARARARGGFWRTKDGGQRLGVEASRLRQDITSVAAELRARAGEKLAITRCSWLRAVACWRKDFLWKWNWTESERRKVERLEAALATHRYARRDAELPPQTLRRYSRELSEARCRLEGDMLEVRALVATAPPPYAEWRSVAGRIQPAQIKHGGTETPHGSPTDVQPEPPRDQSTGNVIDLMEALKKSIARRPGRRRASMMVELSHARLVELVASPPQEPASGAPGPVEARSRGWGW
jgi:hypothetical protein